MFGNQTAKSAARLYADLINAEQRLADLEARLRARHPETLDAAQYAIMQRDFITLIASQRRLLLSLAESIYGRCDSQGDYRD